MTHRSSHVLSLCMLGLVLICTPFAQASFEDVPSTHANFTAINYLQEHGMVQGYNDNTFKPNAAINRAEFAKIVINAFLKNDINQMSTCHMQYARTSEACGLEQNCIAREFTTFAVCMGYKTDNNGQLGTDALKLKEYDSCFSDIAADAWFRKFVCLAKVKNIIGGYADGSFKANNNITFVEASKIIVNAMGFKTTADAVWYRPYVQVLSDSKAIPMSINALSQTITRGEMAEMIYRLDDKNTGLASKSMDSLK